MGAIKPISAGIINYPNLQFVTCGKKKAINKMWENKQKIQIAEKSWEKQITRMLKKHY